MRANVGDFQKGQGCSEGGSLVKRAGETKMLFALAARERQRVQLERTRGFALKAELGEIRCAL